ncbi:Altered inheritance of mitochondria protein 21 [Penicillium ucsense]|nr:Altered inheritance of mitochondria protein 21 [Penicillium ucsense]
MSAQAAPIIPPRPARSPQPGTLSEMPKIPPRPSRRSDRSVSPMRDSYAPSPFNEWNGPSMTRTTSNDLPPRPPSVTIPSIGEEGIEYADLNVGSMADSHHPAPTETRNVSNDLKIHAPRPSLPTSSAKAKVQAVTRTDSRQAAAAGVGRESLDSPALDEHDRIRRPSNSRAGGSRPESAASDRRLSAHFGEEQGFRVPMYPNAGDVQAPSPSPYLEHGSQRQGRNHHRTRSARDSSLPPGSYGLHGHGVHHNDKFEKAWYEKHPDEFVKEEGQYGPGVGTPRPDWALSSDDLNKIVHGPSRSGSGIGTSPAIASTPNEEVGYLASDEYTHRMATPEPDARREHQNVAESPLRQMSFPASEIEPKVPASPLRHARRSSHRPDAEVIHVDDPMHPVHHPDGFSATPASHTETPDAQNHTERDEPILAADEVRPGSAYLHPAISPSIEHRGSFDEERTRTPSLSHSRSNSRSAVAKGNPAMVRYDSRDLHEDQSTPLEDVEEYEPLFPEEGDAKKPRSLSATERFKNRADLLKHRFPSEDIWEDTPNSLQLHATVSTPDLPKSDSSELFETPEQEAARKAQAPKIDSHEVARHVLHGDNKNNSATGTSRPEVVKQRFPSRDIWEDVPESQQLETTVEPASEDMKSPEVPSRPSIPPRPQKQASEASAAEKRQAPVIPDRPKPQIPARPARSSAQTATEPSAGAKAKPAVPARPGGSKIAALKAGFLTDLNSRLQMGPPQPKPQEKEPEAPVEKQPLSDARKGRARGPTRRKPAGDNASARLPPIPEIKITGTWNVWSVGEDGNLTVGSEETKPSVSSTEVSAPSVIPMAPQLAKNTAGEPADPVSEHKFVSGKSPSDDNESQKMSAAQSQAPTEVPTATSTEEPAELEHESSDSAIKATPAKTSTEPLTAHETTPDPSTKLGDALEDLSAAASAKQASESGTSAHPTNESV